MLKSQEKIKIYFSPNFDCIFSFLFYARLCKNSTHKLVFEMKSKRSFKPEFVTVALSFFCTSLEIDVVVRQRSR